MFVSQQNTKTTVLGYLKCKQYQLCVFLCFTVKIFTLLLRPKYFSQHAFVNCKFTNHFSDSSNSVQILRFREIFWQAMVEKSIIMFSYSVLE